MTCHPLLGQHGGWTWAPGLCPEILLTHDPPAKENTRLPQGAPLPQPGGPGQTGGLQPAVALGARLVAPSRQAEGLAAAQACLSYPVQWSHRTQVSLCPARPGSIQVHLLLPGKQGKVSGSIDNDVSSPLDPTSRPSSK